MKTLVFLSALVLLASCDVYVVDPEPIYDPRDKFTGNFDMNEYSATYDEYWEYGVSIYKAAGRDMVIENFYNSGLTVSARVIDEFNIMVPLQRVDGYEIQGNGSISGDKLILSYYVKDTYEQQSPKDFCDATGWRIY